MSCVRASWWTHSASSLEQRGLCTASKQAIKASWATKPPPSSPHLTAVRCNAPSSDQATSFGTGITRRVSVPATVNESVEQAISACSQAKRDGLKRLQLEILLPLIGATDLDDWPGGIQQQFKAAAPIVTSLFEGLIKAESSPEKTQIKSYILDDADAVGVWESEKVALILFPNAECLEKVKALDHDNNGLLLLVNSQWQDGQVISDFGFGAKRKLREEFIATFTVVYYLKQTRILGEDVRVLKCYPGNWQVFVVDSKGESHCIAVEEEKPSYNKLRQLLQSRKGSKSDHGWFGRLLGEFKFNQDSLKGK